MAKIKDNKMEFDDSAYDLLVKENREKKIFDFHGKQMQLINNLLRK